MLSALSGIFKFLGWDDCKVKFLKIQRRLFRDTNRKLTRAEYDRLLASAKELRMERLSLLIETIGATCIRGSEVKYITVEAARNGKAEIALKRKIRVILLSSKLCRKLLKYAKKRLRRDLSPKCRKELTRHQIWAKLKGLCKHADVVLTKVFPHNLRYLFATIFYTACKDIVKLADVLGYSSIETTQIYLMTSGIEHQRQLDRLELVS